MKLNKKRTILVGFAFLSISAFWQMYNSVMPLILTNTFQMGETFSGAVMAADNVFAIFLLPLFGALSDRSGARLGRRMPFILFGTLAAVALMMFLPILDNSYFAAPVPWKKAAFIGILALLLVAMSSYRSPAVALMPDVTPKPLRSRGNAVINLMGAVGGVLYLIVASVLYSSARTGGLAHVSYVLLFTFVAGIMLTALLILLLTIRERKMSEETQAYEDEHPEENLTETDASGREVLPPAVRRSLIFLLCSIGLWFIGYNAMETWFTTYANRVWGMALGDAAFCLTIATGGAILSYIPIGLLASRIGRKKTIRSGVILLSACFFVCFLITLLSRSFTPVLYGLFALMGLAWAAINVNSLPMVVEMCRGSDVGRFTGYYYTFSMAAQIVTPILAGYLLKNVDYLILFPYAAVFVGLSFVTMLFVRHGDNRVPPRRGLEAYDTAD
jgi:maltose/moltooligosaccharide transporter